MACGHVLPPGAASAAAGLILCRLVVMGRTHWVHSRSREQAGLHCCSPRQAASSCPSSHPPSAFPRFPGASETHGDAQDKPWKGRSALPGGAHIRVTAGFEKWKGGMAGRAAELVWFPSHSSWLQKEVTNEPSLVKERKGSAQRPWD